MPQAFLLKRMVTAFTGKEQRLAISNTTFFELIFEALLLVYTLIKWTSLWKTTEQMESRLRYDSNFYQQLRKVSIALVVIFLILVRQVLHFKERKANKQKLNLV